MIVPCLPIDNRTIKEGVLTPVYGCNKRPVSCVDHPRFGTPSVPPVDAVALVLAFKFGPETKVQRRDKEYPVQTGDCGGIVPGERISRTDVQRMCPPCAREIRFMPHLVVDLPTPQ